MATILIPTRGRNPRLEELQSRAHLSPIRRTLRSQDLHADADNAWAGMLATNHFQKASLPFALPENYTSQAMQFYDAELRSVLEPRFNGQYVAIHPSTREYVVERGPGKALRALRARRPEGQIVIHHIGPASSGLKARLRGELSR